MNGIWIHDLSHARSASRVGIVKVQIDVEPQGNTKNFLSIFLINKSHRSKITNKSIFAIIFMGLYQDLTSTTPNKVVNIVPFSPLEN